MQRLDTHAQPVAYVNLRRGARRGDNAPVAFLPLKNVAFFECSGFRCQADLSEAQGT